MPITSLAQLDLNKTYTYADYMKWQLKERVELLRGKVLPMSPAPNLEHQKISGVLFYQLFGYFNNENCRVFSAPFDVRLPVSGKEGKDTTVVQPDLCVICDEHKLNVQGCLGAPDLIVEILSPGNSKKEMREKFSVYEESGVREYWLVNPLDRMVLIYVLNAQGKYIGLAPVTEDDQLQASIFPELQINLQEVFKS